MKYKIQILYREKGQNKNNPEPFVVLYDPKSWPSRITSKRGYNNMRIIFQRDMTKEETEAREKSWRCMAYKYQNIDGLIRDEILALGEDHEEIIILLALKQEIEKNKNLTESFK
jgi:hypothetical protein